MLSKRAAETKAFTIDLGRKLISGEYLTGTATVVEVGTSALTISNVDLALNSQGALIHYCGTVALATASSCWRSVVFTVSGGVAGTTYRIRVTVGTDATAAQTLVREIALRVN